MSISNNFTDYNMYSENEVSTVLSRLDTEYILDIIRDKIDSRFDNIFTLSNPNMVNSIESFFKENYVNYPAEVNRIREVRNERYLDIIDIICNKFNLIFDHNAAIEDLYPVALYLYSLCISDFMNNITNFFINYINMEKNGLYDALKLDELKKNKDINTLYNKKMINNTKLAIINSNLEYVINNICMFDIPLAMIIDIIIYDKQVSRYLNSIISDQGDFFKNNFVSVVNDPNIRPILITNIRIGLQQLYLNDIDKTSFLTIDNKGE